MLFRTSTADSEAVKQVLRGERDAFAVLVERHERAVHGIALSHAVPPAFAEDVVQETFLRAFRQLASLRDPNKFGPWLLQIARNIAIDHARKRMHALALEEETEPPAVYEDPGARELHRLLREEVLNLAPAFREVILLHYFSGKCTREIAVLLDISKAAAQKRLQRARRDLGASLDKHLADSFGNRQPSPAAVASVMAVVATVALPARSEAAAAGVVTTAGLALLVKIATALLVVLLGGWFAWRGWESTATTQPLPTVSAAPSAPGPVADTPESPDEQLEEVEELESVAAEGDAAISGRVTNDKGDAVPGATVVAFAPGGFKAEAVTDEAGQYKLEWLSNASYSVRIRAKGHWPGMLEEVRPGSSRGDVVLTQAPLVAGRVLDAKTRRPIEGVRVAVEDGDEGVTDATGVFEIEPGSTSYVQTTPVTFMAKGYLRVVSFVEKHLLVDLSHLPEVVLEPLPAVLGRVVNREGAPVEGAEVHAKGDAKASGSSPAGGANDLADPLVAVTDGDGTFSIESLEKWPHYVYATHGEYAAASVRYPGPDDTSPGELLITLDKPAAVHGQIRINGVPLNGYSVDVDAGGKVRAGAKVLVGQGGAPHPSVEAEEDGRYYVAGVAPGEITVQLLVSYPLPVDATRPRGGEREGSFLVSKEAVAFAGKTTVLDFDLKVIKLYGRVQMENGGALTGWINVKERGRVPSRVAANFGEEGYLLLIPGGIDVVIQAHANPAGTGSIMHTEVLSLPDQGDLAHNIVVPHGAVISIAAINSSPGARLAVRVVGPMESFLARQSSLMEPITIESAPLGDYRLTLMIPATEGRGETVLAERELSVVDRGDYAVEFDLAGIIIPEVTGDSALAHPQMMRMGVAERPAGSISAMDSFLADDPRQ